MYITYYLQFLKPEWILKNKIRKSFWAFIQSLRKSYSRSIFMPLLWLYSALVWGNLRTSMKGILFTSAQLLSLSLKLYFPKSVTGFPNLMFCACCALLANSYASWKIWIPEAQKNLTPSLTRMVYSSTSIYSKWGQKPRLLWMALISAPRTALA